MQETQDTRVWSLGWEDPLEEEMATYSSILAWRIPWTEKPGGLQSMESKTVSHNWTLMQGLIKLRKLSSTSVFMSFFKN